MEKVTTTHEHDHYDHEGSKLGMWLFIFTELLLFGGLFITYAVYKYLNPDAFHMAAEELNVGVGAINTIILLISSATIAMSITSLQQNNIRLTKVLLEITMMLAITFLINKYFEWGAKISHGIYPGSEHLLEMSRGEILFYGLYFFMTGLHALHIIVGVIFIAVVYSKIIKRKVHAERYVLLENSGLYWHLVDIIWIFLFPLFYLIT